MINCFAKDRSGLAAVEFALVLPILTGLLFGSVAIFDLYKADRATSHAANTIIDLVSRQETMDTAGADAFFAAARGLVGRYGRDDAFEITLAGINADDTNYDGTAELSVGWTVSNPNASDLTDAEIASLSLPEIPIGESVVFIRLRNSYATVFSGERDFARETARRPRFLARIAYE